MAMLATKSCARRIFARILAPEKTPEWKKRRNGKIMTNFNF
jgi:hypothetical protein